MNDPSLNSAPGTDAGSSPTEPVSPSRARRLRRRLTLLVLALVVSLTTPYLVSLAGDAPDAGSRWGWLLLGAGGALLVLVGALLALKLAIAPELDALDEPPVHRREPDADLATRGAVQVTNEYLTSANQEIHATMHAVLGLTQLLLRSPLGSTQLRQMRTIDGAARTLLRIINDLRSLAQNPSGSYDVLPMGASLHDVLRVGADLLEPLARDRALTLVLDVAVDVPDRVLIDAGRVQQIVFGACRYAIERSPPGSLRIEVTARRLDEPRFELLLLARSVPGALPAANPAALAAPKSGQPASGVPASSRPASSQLEPSRPLSEPARSASPLNPSAGLAHPRRLLEALGGTLHVDEATLDLVVSIPVSRIDIIAEGKARARGAKEPALVRLPAISSPILVVEADPSAQLVALELLENLGFDVDVATEAERALERVEQRKYALILMATELPGLDGYSTAARILTRLGQQRPAIVGCARDANSEARARAALAGMDALLPKPIEREPLCSVLAEWLPDEAHPASSGTRLSQSGALEQATRRALTARLSAAPASTLPDLLPGQSTDHLREQFAREVPALVRTLTRAVARGRRDEIATLAEQLKERCSNSGAMKMAALCRTLEGARDLSLEQLSANVKALGKALTAVLALLGESPESPPASATTDRTPDGP